MRSYTYDNGYGCGIKSFHQINSDSRALASLRGRPLPRGWGGRPGGDSADSLRVSLGRPTNRIRVFQWNCCGIRYNLPSLLAIVKEYDILCLQESLLKQSSNLKVKGFKVLRKDIAQAGDRDVCTLVRENLTYDTMGLNILRWNTSSSCLPQRSQSQ